MYYIYQNVIFFTFSLHPPINYEILRHDLAVICGKCC